MKKLKRFFSCLRRCWPKSRPRPEPVAYTGPMMCATTSLQRQLFEAMAASEIIGEIGEAPPLPRKQV